MSREDPQALCDFPARPGADRLSLMAFRRSSRWQKAPQLDSSGHVSQRHLRPPWEQLALSALHRPEAQLLHGTGGRQLRSGMLILC